MKKWFEYGVENKEGIEVERFRTYRKAKKYAIENKHPIIVRYICEKYPYNCAEAIEVNSWCVLPEA